MVSGIHGVRDIKTSLKAILGPAFGFLAVGYFAFHAVHGERGILAFLQMKERIAALETVAAETSDERARWEHRVGLLNGASLDLDLLEERARLMLNVGHANDVVILGPRTPG